MRKDKQKGFTLIEVLVALTVSSFLLALLSQTFHQLASQWETRFSPMQLAAYQSYQQHLIERSLRYAIPFVSPSNNTSTTPVYFNGENHLIHWVTAKPVWENGIAVARLTFHSDSQQGQSNLVYEEQPFTALFSPQDNLSIETGRNFELTVSSGLQFEYFGYKNLEERLALTQEPATISPDWSPDFDGTARQQIPLAVRLSDEAGKLWLHAILPNTDTNYLQGNDS